VKAVVSSDGSDILVHFGDEDFLERFQQFEQHLPDWKQQYPKLAAADMRYERQVVLQMQPGTGVPMTGDSASPAATTAAAALPAAPKPAVTAKAVPVSHPTKAVSKPASRPISHIPVTLLRPKPTTSAGKGKTGNGKIFADLAAARRAQQARAKSAPASRAQ
jgi:cell division protein FtsQ